MKRLILIALIVIPLPSWTLLSTPGDIKGKLSDFFFGLSPQSDLNTIKEQLRNNPEFTFHEDPNRDANSSISGSITTNKNLNPISTRNQLVISLTSLPNGNNEAVSFAWFIDYKIEDLAVALDDCEKLKSEFKPYFRDFLREAGNRVSAGRN